MPFAGKPIWGLGIEKLREAKRVEEIVVATESELIARVALDFGASLLARPVGLASDDMPSIPVFQHLVRNYWTGFTPKWLKGSIREVDR